MELNEGENKKENRLFKTIIISNFPYENYKYMLEIKRKKGISISKQMKQVFNEYMKKVR